MQMPNIVGQTTVAVLSRNQNPDFEQNLVHNSIYWEEYEYSDDEYTAYQIIQLISAADLGASGFLP
jgi:hypothetical protein